MLCKIKLLELQNSESRDIAARMQRILFRSGCLNEVAQWLDFYGRESEGWESQNLWRAIQPYILQDKKIREQVTVESDSGFGKPVRIVGFSREGFGVASPLVPRVVPIDISIEGPLALAFESAVQQILGSAVLKRPSE
jgi:hypothetical protein